jgi:hypothetical protein
VKPAVPSETLCIVQTLQHSFWCQAKLGDQAATQVNFDGWITNITGRPNRIVRVEIATLAADVEVVTISNDHDARRPQSLAPGETAEVRATLFVRGARTTKGKPWRATLIFIDQYGNRHKVKGAVFKDYSPQT